MTPHFSEEISTRIDWKPFAIRGNTMPPRDPEEEDDYEDEEDEEDEEDDERPVVREPDEEG